MFYGFGVIRKIAYNKVLRDEAEIKVPRCAEFLFVIFVATSGA